VARFTGAKYARTRWPSGTMPPRIAKLVIGVVLVLSVVVSSWQLAVGN
jgi:hypothetical protein